MKRTLFAGLLTGCVAAGLLFADEPKGPVPGGLPPGVVSKELKDQRNERSLFVSVTNDALTRGGFNALAKRLATPDRKRMTEFAKEDLEKLDGRIAQIEKVWQEKYGTKFDFDDQKILESFIVIREGEVSDPEAVKMNWPVPVTDRSVREAMTSNAPDSSAEYLTKGRDVAIASIPASNGLPAMHISLLHESMDSWRLDIPDNITGEQIHQNLLNRLTEFGENVSTWPVDVNEAYRVVMQKVIASIYNVNNVKTGMEMRQTNAE